jgi:hypothetical protein
MAPDRFHNAFRIGFRLASPFGTDHTCTCGFSLRDKIDSHPLRCNAHSSNYKATLAFVKSLARDAGYHAPKGDVVSVSPPLAQMAYVLMGLLLSPTKTPQKTSPSMCLARTPPIFLSEGLHPTFSLRKPSRPVTRRMPLTRASSMIIRQREGLLLLAPFPALGNTTLISGPSHAYLYLPPHSPKLGAFFLSLTMLMMPNATICNMLYKNLPLPHYHLVFTM